jgi:dinuclear metal center YbgI/SA1388 family protein
MTASLSRQAFRELLDGWLSPGRFNDVAENGLQVEGKDTIRKVACGVSANRAFLEAAVAAGADAVVVHHGLVWGGGVRRLDGWLLQRVRVCLDASVNLFAYHLPLDAQPAFGNNAGLAGALGLADVAPFGAYKGQLIGCRGVVDDGVTLSQLVGRVRERVGAPLCVFGDPARVVKSVGVCTGGAPDLLHEAIGAGLDLYVTGEATEWVKAVSDESGVAFIAAGHHQTERFGPRGLAQALSAHGLDATFIDVENPA